MKLPNSSVIFCALALAVFTACGKQASEHAHEHAHGHEHAAEDHAHHHDHDHEAHDHSAEGAKESHGAFGDEIVLEPKVAQRFGVKCDTVSPVEFHTVVRASGMALQSTGANAVVAAPVAGIVRLAPGIELGKSVGRGATVAVVDASGVAGGNSNAAAKAAFEAAKDEYERIQNLYNERLATISELTAAKSAYEQAKATYSPRAGSGAAVAPIAGTVTAINVPTGTFVNVGDPIATIASDRNLTLRIDLPQKYFRDADSFADAVIELPFGGGSFTVAERGGRRVAGTAIPATAGSGFVPVYFTVPNDGSLMPASSFTAYLLGKPRGKVLAVPSAALSEQQGQFFVYERMDEECYMKRPVNIGASDGRSVEIISGIHPGDVIVTEGTTTVRLAESGAAIPEGHTHNH